MPQLGRSRREHMAHVFVQLSNPPIDAISWCPIFYVDNIPFLPEEDLDLFTGWYIDVPEGETIFRCVINYVNDQAQKDITAPMTLIDGQTYIYDWTAETFEADIVLGQGASDSDLNTFLSSAVSLPVGTKFRIRMTCNLLVLQLTNYSNFGAYATHELTPLFNKSGLTVDLPITGINDITITGTVTGDWTDAQAHPDLVLAGAGVPWMIILAGIKAVAMKFAIPIAATLITYFIFRATSVYITEITKQTEIKARIAEDAMDHGYSPSEANDLANAAGSGIKLPDPKQWIEILKWAAIGVGAAVVGVTIIKLLPKKS
jgi:hypothetical protein